MQALKIRQRMAPPGIRRDEFGEYPSLDQYGNPQADPNQIPPPPPPPQQMAMDAPPPQPPPTTDAPPPPPSAQQAPPQIMEAPPKPPSPTMEVPPPPPQATSQAMPPPPPQAPSAAPPPLPPESGGRNPTYRQGRIAAIEERDAGAAPPLSPQRIQGSATQQYMNEAQRVAGERPKLWQNIAGAFLPNVDFHPNITQDRRNLPLYKARADEERALQQAQANEELKNKQLEVGDAEKAAHQDTLTTNAQTRELNAKTHSQAVANQQFETALKIGGMGGKKQATTDPVPAGFSVIPAPNEPGMVYVVPETKSHFIVNPAFRKMADSVGIGGTEDGQMVSFDVWKQVAEAAGKVAAVQAKPEKEPAKDDKAIAIMAKPEAQRTPDEVAFLKGYRGWVKETKTEPGVARVEMMGQTREMPVLDTKNQNSPMYLSAADINKANQAEPGRYIPASTSAPALTKTALLEDIRGNVQQVRQSLTNIPDFTGMDKAKIAIALKSRDPKGAISALISGGAAGALTPQQQDYLINTTNLIENAMAMRSVLGAGQGSEDLRSAIMATIPGPATPDKQYAMKQLDTFEKVLGRLERGVPKVPLRTDVNGGGQGWEVTVNGVTFPNQAAADAALKAWNARKAK